MNDSKSNEDVKKESVAIRRKGLTYLLLTGLLVLTSYLSIWFIRSMFGGGDIMLSFSFLTPETVTYIVVILLAYFAFDALRLHYSLRTLGIRISFPFIIKLTFIGIFVTAVTPFSTGGGFVQVFFLVREKVPIGSAMAAATMRTLLGVFFFLIAAPIIVLTNPVLLELIGDGYTFIFIGTLVIFLLIIAVLLWLIFHEKSAKHIFYKLLDFCRRIRLISPNIARKLSLKGFTEIHNFASGLSLFFRGSRKYISLTILYTLLFLFTLVSIPMLLTWVMGYMLSPVFVYQAVIVINFVMNFALTPGASGIAEGGFALLFSSAVSKADIEELIIMWRSLSVYAGAVIGMFVFYQEMFFKRIKKRVNGRC